MRLADGGQRAQCGFGLAVGIEQARMGKIVRHAVA